MARSSTCLNFRRNTEDAFNFYKSVFGTESANDIARMGDVPVYPGQPELSDADSSWS
jgi:PhnB protein